MAPRETAGLGEIGSNLKRVKWSKEKSWLDFIHGATPSGGKKTGKKSVKKKKKSRKRGRRS